jgi:hypothetical protein
VAQSEFERAMDILCNLARFQATLLSGESL